MTICSTQQVSRLINFRIRNLLARIYSRRQTLGASFLDMRDAIIREGYWQRILSIDQIHLSICEICALQERQPFSASRLVNSLSFVNASSIMDSNSSFWTTLPHRISKVQASLPAITISNSIQSALTKKQFAIALYVSVWNNDESIAETLQACSHEQP